MSTQLYTEFFERKTGLQDTLADKDCLFLQTKQDRQEEKNPPQLIWSPISTECRVSVGIACGLLIEEGGRNDSPGTSCWTCTSALICVSGENSSCLFKVMCKLRGTFFKTWLWALIPIGCPLIVNELPMSCY